MVSHRPFSKIKPYTILKHEGSSSLSMGSNLLSKKKTGSLNPVFKNIFFYYIK